VQQHKIQNAYFVLQVRQSARWLLFCKDVIDYFTTSLTKMTGLILV
jgi:hypothetical protein